MRTRRPVGVMNVAELPDVVFGPADIMWWGSFAFIVIEGWTLVLCAAVFIYLRQNSQTWPPAGTPLPSLGPRRLYRAMHRGAPGPRRAATRPGTGRGPRRSAAG